MGFGEGLDFLHEAVPQTQAQALLFSGLADIKDVWQKPNAFKKRVEANLYDFCASVYAILACAPENVAPHLPTGPKFAGPVCNGGPSSYTAVMT